MPNPEATPENLFKVGNTFRYCLTQGNTIPPEAMKVIQAELLRLCGYQIYTVWHAHDPFVKEKGKRGLAYKTIMAHAAARAQDEAAEFLKWYEGSLDFSELSALMQNLAVIVFVAEVGRGYTQQAIEQLIGFLRLVASGHANWNQLKDYYPPALTAREDDLYDE